VKTEVLDRSADRDRKDKTEDHVLLDQKVKTVDQDQRMGRDQKGKIVQKELLL
jgi:hypothetical protein